MESPIVAITETCLTGMVLAELLLLVCPDGVELEQAVRPKPETSTRKALKRVRFFIA
jgi:hypothetical protein